MAKVLK
jgi:hypothetical protein